MARKQILENEQEITEETESLPLFTPFAPVQLLHQRAL